MNQNDVITGILLDENLRINLAELCNVCHTDAEIIIEMVEEGVISPQGLQPQEWRFSGTAIKRIQIAMHLTRDLRVNLAGAALALDLMDELETLRKLRASL